MFLFSPQPLAILCLVNIYGVKLMAKVQDISMVVKLLAIVLLIITGLIYIGQGWLHSFLLLTLSVHELSRLIKSSIPLGCSRMLRTWLAHTTSSGESNSKTNLSWICYALYHVMDYGA